MGMRYHVDVFITDSHQSTSVLKRYCERGRMPRTNNRTGPTPLDFSLPAGSHAFRPFFFPPFLTLWATPFAALGKPYMLLLHRATALHHRGAHAKGSSNCRTLRHGWNPQRVGCSQSRADKRD